MPPANLLKLKPFVLTGPRADLNGALCAAPELDPETWHSEDAVTQKIAKGYCHLCPLGKNGNDACYTEAIREEIEAGYLAFGIRGGRDASKRQKLLDLLKIREELGLVDESS